jgi:hypothetical protein
MCFASYNASYFKQFIGKEVFVTLNDPMTIRYKHNFKVQNTEVLIRVESIDDFNNIVVGKSNDGTYHLDASQIISVREQRSCISGVYTN